MSTQAILKKEVNFTTWLNKIKRLWARCIVTAPKRGYIWVGLLEGLKKKKRLKKLDGPDFKQIRWEDGASAKE